MIPTIVAALSLVTILLTTSVIVAKGTDMKKQYDDKLRMLTDQINNAQHYNSEIDKKNIESIKDVRATYATKDEIARSVDTREMTSKKATITDLSAESVNANVLKGQKATYEFVSANKLTSPHGIMDNLESGLVNAGKVNLLGHKDNKGILNFDSSGQYYMQKQGPSISVGMPNNASFKVLGENTISVQPTKGEISFNNKWSLGKLKNPTADNLGIKYEAMGMSFDNKEIVGLYSLADGRKFTRMDGYFEITGKDDSWIAVTSDEGDPIFMGTNSQGKGIATFGNKPFDVFASKFRTGNSEIGGVDFNNKYDPKSTNPALIHDAQNFNIYGKPKNGAKTTQFIDNVDIVGTAKAKNVVGTEGITMSDNAAYMRPGGLVYGRDLIGMNVRGNEQVSAGNNAVLMKKDGSLKATTINAPTITGTNISSTNMTASDKVTGKNLVATGSVSVNNNQALIDANGGIIGNNITARNLSTGKTVTATDSISTGAASMAKDGSVKGNFGIFNERVSVGNVQMSKAGDITAKTMSVDSINPQSGLTVTKGPMKLANGVMFGVDGSAANNRFYVGADGKVGVGTATPRTNVDVIGNMYVNGISRPPGDTTNLRINYENSGKPTAAKIELHNGAYVSGNGMFVGGTSSQMPANGILQTTDSVVTPKVGALAGADWFRVNHLNENNTTNQGTAVYNGLSVHGGRGLYVGNWKASPAGVIEATNKVVAPVIEAKNTLTAPSFSAPTLTATTSLTAPSVTASTNVNSPKFVASTETISPVFKTGSTATDAIFNSTSISVPNVDASTKINAPSIGLKAGQSSWFMLNPDNATAGVRVNGPFATSGGIYSGSSTTNKEAAGVIRAASSMCVNNTCLTETDIKNLKSKLLIS